MPWLDKLFLKNPIRLWLSKYNLLSSNSPVVDFAAKRMASRQDEKIAIAEKSETPGTRDFLSRFKEAGSKDPEFISNERVRALTVANMFAGSDTTAISLRAVFYNLLKSPSRMERLMKELAEERETGRFTRSDGLVKWDEVRQLPYLSAVIKEALRCHPAVGLLLERVVPPRGVSIGGTYIPGGTIVGCSAWVVHRDEKVFGADADKFRPERWLEASPSKASEMNNFLFSFGAGARTCIGKNISYLEMYKLVPAILQNFEVSFPTSVFSDVPRPDILTFHSA